MIDTWARHLAAVSEARRLIRMVLDNNPAFVELARVPSSPVDEALTADVHYQAYVHLNEALAAMRPIPGPADAVGGPTPSLCDQIAGIVPAQPRPAKAEAANGCAASAVSAAIADRLALDRLRERLRYVLEGPHEVQGAAGGQAAFAADGWVASPDEARVAIVRHGAGADQSSPGQR